MKCRKHKIFTIGRTRNHSASQTLKALCIRCERCVLNRI